MCGTNQSKTGQFEEFEQSDLFLDEYRAPSAYVLKQEHLIYSQFYDNGFRLFNLQHLVDKTGKAIQEENYFPKWGEYLIDVQARLEKETDSKIPPPQFETSSISPPHYIFIETILVNRSKLYIGYSVRFNAMADVKHDDHLKQGMLDLKLRTPRQSELNLTMNFDNSTVAFPGGAGNNVMQHNDMISLDMRHQSYTERMTYFNSFKKSNGATFVDREFPPTVESIFVNYNSRVKPGIGVDYQTHSKQLIPNELIKTIIFQSVNKLTPLKDIYLTDRPDSFHVFPSYIINPAFPIILHILNRSRSIFNKLFPKRTLDESGVHRIGLFLDFKWQEIEIDDQLPIISNTILSTWCNTQEAWPALLEKALAKVVGGYEYLSVIGHGHLDKADPQQKSRTRTRMINTLERASTSKFEYVTQNLENLLRICTGCFSKRYYFRRNGMNATELNDYLTFWENMVKVNHCIILKTNEIPQGTSERTDEHRLLPNHM